MTSKDLFRSSQSAAWLVVSRAGQDDLAAVLTGSRDIQGVTWPEPVNCGRRLAGSRSSLNGSDAMLIGLRAMLISIRNLPTIIAAEPSVLPASLTVTQRSLPVTLR